MEVCKMAVPQWFIMEHPIKKDDLGVPRGMEKQGLFGQTPAAGFFSHANDQKPA